MGVTLASMHAYTPDPIPEAYGAFQSLSPQWQSLLIEGSDYDFQALSKLGKKLSKDQNVPVLLFQIIDDDAVCFDLLHQGRRVARFNPFTKTGILKVAPLVGYPEGNKRRLVQILNCPDPDELVPLLEEYFGVSLRLDPEMLEMDPDRVVRAKSDKLYRAFRETYKPMRSLSLPYSLEFVREYRGGPLHDCSPLRRSFYQLAFVSSDDPEDLHLIERLIKFENGRLRWASPKEQLAGTVIHRWGDGIWYEMDEEDSMVHFLEAAPPQFRGKTFRAPPGYYTLGMDEEHLILYDERDHIAVMDAEGRLLARLACAGPPMEFTDGFLLCDSPFFCQGPNMLRIYRLVPPPGEDGKD